MKEKEKYRSEGDRKREREKGRKLGEDGKENGYQEMRNSEWKEKAKKGEGRENGKMCEGKNRKSRSKKNKK